MRRFAGHQEGKRVFHARIVGHVDQAFIDDLRPRLRRDIRPQVGGGFADSINVGRRPRHARRVGQRGTAAVQQGCNMAVIAVGGERTIEFRLALGALRQGSFGAFIQHADQSANDLQMAQLLCRDIHQHIFAAGIVIA